MAPRYYTASQLDERNHSWIASSDGREVSRVNRGHISEESFCYAGVDTFSSSAKLPQGPSTTSINSDRDKSLPQSPTVLRDTDRGPSSLRAFSRRKLPSQLEPTHLRPEEVQIQHPVSSVSHYRNYSQSMPKSPHRFYQPQPPSAHTVHEPSTSRFLAPRTHKTRQCMPSDQRQTLSSNHRVTAASSRSSICHPSTSLSPATRDNNTCRPRPHSWLPSTEPSTDQWQPHLFAEAITGLPDEPEFCSPSSMPRLQGSHFARRVGSDAIPLLRRWPEDTLPAQQRRQQNYWQNFEPPPVIAARPESTSSLRSTREWQPPHHVQALEIELGLLDLEDERNFDDELPNYTQSQAEVSSQRQLEASSRARELEARWQNAR